MGVYAGPANAWSNFTDENRIDASTKVVVQDGLVLNFDAGASTSYPGSGTSWTDLSGNGNNGTLVNGVGFDSDYGGSLSFDGSNQYISLGGAPESLKLTDFSLYCWFQWKTGGSTTSTGSGGVTFYPIITKGRGENGSEGNNKDMNYGFGIDTSSNIAADFEDFDTGGNHPITGTTTILKDTWYNVTVTYDGISWKIYINGNLSDSLTVNETPRYDSIQHNAIGTAMLSTGSPEGYFSGKIAISSIYNKALTASEVSQNFNALRSRFGI